eukprot:CAMPEP_0180612272 /NCGR_PEP_ID=MMETSP1037_2-20121125/30275_1 /TAXON_ID=632150 /ORGANISM="Azadinium spinosum, Strain 3D9" /LENGTH=459 /DNA_ID=CAMNT_0022631867 /DNA_START=63 /DNA_END=1444 /DNA_ORIENTATION=+
MIAQIEGYFEVGQPVGEAGHSNSSREDQASQPLAVQTLQATTQPQRTGVAHSNFEDQALQFLAVQPPQAITQPQRTGVAPSNSLYSSECLFCGCHVECEYGRDLTYCSLRCYEDAHLGQEALAWHEKDVTAYLNKIGLFRWMRYFAPFDGKTLLTSMSEGVLCRVGVPKGIAKNVMADVESLRQGVWLQPEAPRSELPLMTVADQGKQANSDWSALLVDEAHRSYVAYCPKAIDANIAWVWFSRLFTELPWQDLCDSNHQKNGQVIPRRTIFTVMPGCSCVYKYSGVRVPPTIEPGVVGEIRKYCAAMAGFTTDSQPNCCNINLYRDGRDSVGWHTDNEEIFESEYNDACILSLSLGASRKFQLKRQQTEADPHPKTVTAIVSHGDLCTMEGRFQRYYLHEVPKMFDVKESRINLTWRWITKHNQADGCAMHGPGNAMPGTTTVIELQMCQPLCLAPPP